MGKQARPKNKLSVAEAQESYVNKEIDFYSLTSDCWVQGICTGIRNPGGKVQVIATIHGRTHYGAINLVQHVQGVCDEGDD
jgi:hypothetical protein